MSCCDIICVEQADKTLKSTAFFVQFNYNPYKTKRTVKVLVNDRHTDLELKLEPKQLRCYLFPPHKAETNDEVHKEEKAKNTAVEAVDQEEAKKNKKELKKKEPQLKRKKLFKSAVNYLFPEEKTLSNMETDKIYALDQLTPTNEQLQGLGLQDGLNTITFVLDGDENNLVQTVDGSIFKWHVSDRIVLCDIDGTVTKSDTMGLILTAVGYYSYVHPGICSLLSSLENRGYKILFLTARSITHGAKTRKFIQQIRQENDGKMPHGPILTSYNNLLHAAVREYILYRSDNFKIEALRGIQSLFNKDENPFVMGLGNKPTDHESYVTVGIPIDNIFIIDPAGKVKGLKSKSEYQYTGYEEVQHMLGDLLPDVLLPAPSKDDHHDLPSPIKEEQARS